MTKVGVILQARMSSQRFPRKVLYEICGKPMLAYTLERLAYCRNVNTVIIATSNDTSDNPIEHFCTEWGVNCFRGSLMDVAGRFAAAASQYSLEVCVRVNGDSPLLDQQLIDYGVDVFDGGGFDLVTNVFPRTYPKGFSVEVLRVSALHYAHPLMVDDVDREHVTRYFYQHPELFRIHNFSFKTDCSDRQMSVDTSDDMKLFKAIIGAMDKPHWQYGVEEVMDLADRLDGRGG